MCVLFFCFFFVLNTLTLTCSIHYAWEYWPNVVYCCVLLLISIQVLSFNAFLFIKVMVKIDVLSEYFHVDLFSRFYVVASSLCISSYIIINDHLYPYICTHNKYDILKENGSSICSSNIHVSSAFSHYLKPKCMRIFLLLSKQEIIKKMKQFICNPKSTQIHIRDEQRMNLFNMYVWKTLLFLSLPKWTKEKQTNKIKYVFFFSFVSFIIP